MGGFLEEPNRFKNIYLTKTKRLRVVTASMQGWVKEQEDHLLLSLVNSIQVPFFGVFDGCYGAGISEYMARNLQKRVVDLLIETKDPGRALSKSLTEVEGYVGSQQGMRNLKANPNMKQTPEQMDHMGSTANLVLLTETKAYCANVGNSRAVLVCEDKVRLSVDHSLQNQVEYRRAKQLNIKTVNGLVNGVTECTRLIGCRRLKEHRLISYHPELREASLQGARLLLMASRGLWQCMEEDDILNYFFCEEEREDEESVKLLLDDCLAVSPYKSEVGKDNMSLILVRFL